MNISLRQYDIVDKVDLNPNIPINTIEDEEEKKENIISRVMKRIIDIIGGFVGLVVLIPLTCIIYLANLLLGDRGPIFFVQERIGKNGKIFKMLKYRSMVVGADDILKRYLQENDLAREEYRKYKKLKDDPRITKIGNFIRKTSLDEFPQFINVLKGDMSLVGPRPYLPREKEHMKDYYQYIIQSKPGLTGFWQTAGRSDVTFDERLKMDYTYNRKKNLIFDFKILLRTVLNVVKKEGAI